MTIPSYVTEDWWRALCREMRRRFQFDTKIKNEDGVRVDACSLEEEVAKMIRRHQLVPHEMLAIDGFAGGGGGGARSYRDDGTPQASTERMGIDLADVEYRADYDYLNALLAKTADKADQGNRAFRYVQQLADEHKRTSVPEPPSGHTVSMCPTVGGAVDEDGNVPAPVPCGEIAEPGRRLCRGCRQALQTLNERREAIGEDRLKDLPKHEADRLFEERAKRRQTIDPTDPLTTAMGD